MKRIAPILLVLAACGGPVATEPQDPVDRLVREAPAFLEDRGYRRASLEKSLWRPELPYARARLDAYALPRGGWDALPATVGESLAPARTPVTRDEWIALGERVFWELPMRWDGYLAWVSAQPELWDDFGFESTDEGELRGVVPFTDARGVPRTGLTCGACHGSGGVAGRPNRDLDLGAARAAYFTERGLPTAPFDAWGPGRVDVTDDDVVDPLSFPPLFGVRHNQNLNRSGAIKIDGNPAAIAIRFETQYIEGHSLLARPDRRLPLALAIFVLSLADTVPAVDAESDDARAFDRACGSCHDSRRGFSGGLVLAETLNSDDLAARSAHRGTGYYKVPSLLGAGDGGPYLHDGSVETLADLIDAGHPFGITLSEEDRGAVLRFVSTMRSQP